MNTLLPILLVTMFCASTIAQVPEGDVIPFRCNVSHVQAVPASAAWDGFNWAQRHLLSLEIEKVSNHVYRLKGQVSGPDAHILIGNMAVSHTLEEVATPDTNQWFNFTIDNRTGEDFPESPWVIGLANEGVLPLTHEAKYRNRKYLFVARRGIKLRRYEIPYGKVEQAAAADVASSAAEQ